MAVVVFGSINMDLVARTPRLPIAGETLSGYSFETIPGGKGANQAVAVARLGIPTQMVGRVGADQFGQALLASLRASGVGCDRIRVDQSTSSGVAMIAVDDQSENQIIIVPGANGQVGLADIDHLEAALSNAKVLLLQLEIPLPMVMAAADVARRAGITVILDPAPVPADLPAELYAIVDLITPNQVEAAQLVGFPIKSHADMIQAGQVLQQRGTQTVLIKLGKRGVFCMNAAENFVIPAFPVRAIDTVGAGDAFNGGLAAGLAQGFSLRHAAFWGVATAALSVTKPGAQPSMPTRSELDTLLKPNAWKRY
jgi:ribokinase